MARETQRYKRTLAGSVGSGVKSIFGGSKKQYYILEHRIGSKYHQAGEQQEIIVDQAEIGRDAKCQVRFDEYFETVSRRHAAIVRKGNHWKLVPLSQVNPVLLNGQKVQKEWFLQHGDEIQCAINGPKLGFMIPSGKKKTAGSISLSRRLKLFGKQVLRPHRRTIAILLCIILLAIAGGVGYLIFSNATEMNTAERDKFTDKVADLRMEEPVKSFLKNVLPANYSFYTLEMFLPVTMDDLRTNGIRIGSRVPDGLLPSNVIGQLYGGGFLSGTMLTLDKGSDGMDKFDGIKLLIAIGISPDGCVNAMRNDGAKQVILFSDDDAKRISGTKLIKIVFK